jgi:hypothetical protein
MFSWIYLPICGIQKKRTNESSTRQKQRPKPPLFCQTVEPTKQTEKPRLGEAKLTGGDIGASGRQNGSNVARGVTGDTKYQSAAIMQEKQAGGETRKTQEEKHESIFADFKSMQKAVKLWVENKYGETCPPVLIATMICDNVIPHRN